MKRVLRQLPLRTLADVCFATSLTPPRWHVDRNTVCSLSGLFGEPAGQSGTTGLVGCYRAYTGSLILRRGISNGAVR